MQVLLNLLSGVALLVWGTYIVRTGVIRVFGPALRQFLARSVSNRGRAFCSGLVVTALMQSSSAIALIASSFVSQGLIPLGPALVLMLGANVGSAVMAMVFSLDLSWLSPMLIFAGVTIYLPRRHSRIGQGGRVMLGLGLIILALQLVLQATHPITHADETRVILGTLSGDVVLDLLLGVLLTLLTWSSLSVVLLAAAFVGANVITVPVAMTLVLGANLGSGVLALMVNFRAQGAGRHVAVANLLFKLIGCIVFAPLIHWMPELIAKMDPSAQRQVLHFHVLYNLVVGAAFLFQTDRFAALVKRFVPEADPARAQAQPRHLDPAALKTPAIALANAARETLRLGDTVEQMLAGVMQVIRSNDDGQAEELGRLEDDIDRLYSAIKHYLMQISREALDDRESLRWSEIMQLTINLEHVGDLLENVLQDLRDRKIAHRLSFSPAGVQEIEELHARLIANLRLGLSVFLNGDLHSAQLLLAEKERFRDLERAFAGTHFQRLLGQTVQSIETSALHLDIISDLRRINSFFCSTAYPILERAGQLHHSRLRHDDENRALAPETNVATQNQPMPSPGSAG